MKFRIVPFALFSVLGFAPLFFGYFLLLILLLLNIDIGLRNQRGMLDFFSATNIALAVGIPIFLLVISSVSYAITTRLSSWLANATVIFAAWQLLGFPLAFLFSAALAGASMAVVEGAASGADLWLQELQAAIEILFAMQFCAVPWTSAAIFLMSRFLKTQIWPTPRNEGRSAQSG